MPMPKKPRAPCKVCSKKAGKPGAIYCSNLCQKEFEYQEYIKRWRNGLETGNTGNGQQSVSKHIRKYLMEKFGERCIRCGWSERHPVTKNVPLAVDHIDGDWSNTIETNLALLCPNCHSLTPAYGSLNRGRGRLGRKKSTTNQGGRHDNTLTTKEE